MIFNFLHFIAESRTKINARYIRWSAEANLCGNWTFKELWQLYMLFKAFTVTRLGAIVLGSNPMWGGIFKALIKNSRISTQIVTD